METLLIIMYALSSDPSVVVITQEPIQNRIVCEVKEGMLNRGMLRYGEELQDKVELHGMHLQFVRAFCDPE